MKAEPLSPAGFRFGRFELFATQRKLLAGGEAVTLGARAFDVLLALVEARDRVLGSDELLARAWPGLVVEENNIRQQVAALRKVLGGDAVVTVPGRGYRFAWPVDDLATLSQPDAAAGNLSLHAWPLIGREAEVERLLVLLPGVRLLTLTGAGGVGKTRLAEEVARSASPGYRDGAWMVELAAIADPGLLVPTVAAVLHVHEEPGRALADTLLDFLAHKRMLLVLDNCEHLARACAQWAEGLLRRSATTRLIATSREVLAIEGENVWCVPSLATPDDDEVQLHDVLAYPATQLFIQRAGAASPGFCLTATNARAVAQICRQLDGIPLALELAAARVRSMRVEQVAERLHDRFALLTGGTRTALPRHQTLRSLVNWSHELLDESERVLLRRLSVFAGGWTIDAMEAVCSGGRLDRRATVAVLGRLVEKSLVILDDTAPDTRYRMLETIRQYASERLGDAREADAVRGRHLLHFCELAERMREKLFSRDAVRCTAVLDAELDNLRIALDTAEQLGEAASGLELICALHRYWYHRMHWREIPARIERLAQQRDAQGAPTPERARCLYVAAMLVTNFDPPSGRRLAQDCLARSRAMAYDEGVAWSLMWLGYIDARKRDPATRELFAESLRVGRHISDPWRRAALLTQALVCSAGYEALMGRDDAVEASVRECELQIQRIGGDLLYSGHCRALLGTLATRRSEFERAARLLGESLALYRELNSKFDVAGSFAQQGFLELQRGNPTRALALFRESLPLHRDYPTSPWVTKNLAHLVIALAACQRWSVAARLAGVLSPAGVEGEGQLAAPADLSGRAARDYENAIVNVHVALGATHFRREHAQGAGMSRVQAIELALAA